MQEQGLYDTFGRKHNYLRISLTDACNLRCTYCMPDEKVIVTPSHKMMQVDEIVEIAKVFVSLGVNKIRLTGGEPLVRKDAKLIIQQLAKLPVELSISTNAVLVNEFIEDFKQANIRSVNVSLDTLNADDFLKITKRGEFEKIKQNLFLLVKEGFKVKLNMVVMKGINENAILDFIELTKDFALDARFIEFMPFSGNDWNREKVFTQTEMLQLIQTKYNVLKLEDELNDTAKKYKVPGHKGNFGFISTVSNPFCNTCNRLRLTADGKMKNCLFSEGETDLLNAYRNGINIEPLIIENLQAKKQALGGRFDFENIENRSMIKIGVKTKPLIMHNKFPLRR
ncbi:MAG: GTP 3',8-cyclase MoaA [Bacteroidetes bacterium]|nr:GTP 3',8-cyclase MoaA [Bacteroidota bacterium]